jgi:hypothetical protein
VGFRNSWSNITAANPCVVGISGLIGDILVGIACTDVATAGDFNAMAGWSGHFQGTSTNDGMCFAVFSTKLTSGLTSVSFSTGSTNPSIAAVAAFDGRDLTTWHDVAPATTATSTAGTTTNLATTPVTNGVDLVWGQGQDNGNSDYAFNWSGTNTGVWTTRVDIRSTFINCAIGTASQVTAGLCSGRVVSTNGGRVGVLLALRPAAGGAPATPPLIVPAIMQPRRM